MIRAHILRTNSARDAVHLYATVLSSLEKVEILNLNSALRKSLLSLSCGIYILPAPKKEGTIQIVPIVYNQKHKI